MANLQPLPDPETFAEEMEARLRAAEGITVHQRDGLTLRLKVGGTELQVNLENFFRAYSQQPAAIDLVAETLLNSLRSYDGSRTATSFASLRERVFPMLKPIAFLASIRDRGLPMVVYRPFLADLIITYVIDEPTSVSYINEDHLERWQISEVDLREQAITNLKLRTDERGNYTVAGEGAQRLVVFNTQDGFDATRLLVTSMLAELQVQFPGTMVIGVPNRDFLVAFSDADETIASSVAAQIQRDAAEREHGLTDQLFQLIQGEVRLYEWE
ncbi:MAG: DUF1444 family protein [Oscillochloris sp.]|nr:DUF1444 family protein [Oscillochloris sp.]